MKRVLLKIAYVGTAYHGWQVQPNGVTVQQVLQDALEHMLKARPNLTGCSRTDAGVHAKAFYCHFDTDANIPEKGITAGLNAELPKDIAVLESRYVDPGFHARYSAKGKNYLYLIHNASVRDPFLTDRAWHIERPLDLAAMNAFCEAIVGTHDFIGFSSSGRTVVDTVRTVSDCRVTRDGEMVSLSITADGFLYNMVRIAAGTAVAVSDGQIDPSDTKDLIVSKDRTRAGITAPAHGLYLNKVFY